MNDKNQQFSKRETIVKDISNSTAQTIVLEVAKKNAKAISTLSKQMENNIVFHHSKQQKSLS